MEDRIFCRVCDSGIDRAALDLAAPALTTTNLNIDAPTRIYVCASCAHVQSPELPDLATYYDTHYKFYLDSEEHDHLYEMRDGVPVYRSDRQVEVLLDKTALPKGAQVLDYGAAKGSTLRKVVARRPDLSPHVFDVSEDYRPSWSSWLETAAMATYSVPETWSGRFDLVTAHYVLEHVPDPAAVLRSLARLLKPGGQIFFSVPDWTQNTGDLLVADHINHFTSPSLRRLAQEAGVVVEDIDAAALPVSFAVVCRPAQEAAPAVSGMEVESRPTRHARRREPGTRPASV